MAPLLAVPPSPSIEVSALATAAMSAAATAGPIVAPSTAGTLTEGATGSADPPTVRIPAQNGAPNWLAAGLGVYVQAAISDSHVGSTALPESDPSADRLPGGAPVMAPSPPLPRGQVLPGPSSAARSSGAQGAQPQRKLGLSHAQFLLGGKVSQQTGLTLRIQAAGDTPYLAEGYGALCNQWLSLALGWMRAPLGAESLADDWSLPAVTRPGYITSPIDGTEGNTFGSFTQTALGLSVTGGVTALKLFVGQVDAAARVEVGLLPQLKLGAFYLSNNPFFPWPTIGRVDTGPAPAGFHDRWGADAQWRAGAVLVGAEFLRGYERTTRVRSGVFTFGMHEYVLWDVGTTDQLLARYENFSPNYKDPTESAVQTLVFGWNHALPAPGARLQLQYAHDFLPGRGNAAKAIAAVGLKL